MKKGKKQTKLLDDIANFLGTKREDLPLTLETEEEKLYEAQAVINYFVAHGEGFKKAICVNCAKEFAYAYHYEGIKTCSIKCMSENLERIGLKWTPSRPLPLRWGRIYPAVVPSNALPIVEHALAELDHQQHQNESQSSSSSEVLPQDTLQLQDNLDSSVP